MKRIIPILLILGLVVVVLIQYLKLRSLNPPEAYEYTLREDIDLDYHQPTSVGAYYEAARNVGLYARDMWHNEGVNVRLPDSDDAEEVEAARHYNRLLSFADSLGARLARSQKLKLQGFNNGEIIRMENDGVSPRELEIERTFGGTLFKKGDESNGVWVIQELLIQKGYVMPHDGYFWEETRLAVREFQSKSKLPTTGVADLKTLNQMLNQ